MKSGQRVQNVTSILDQAESLNTGMARLLGSFYTELKTHSIPEGLAGEVILAYYNTVMFQQMDTHTEADV